MTKACLLIALSVFLHANIKAQTGGKTYAVVIGVSAYESAGIKPLRFADKDAEAFAAFLQSPAGGNLPDSQLLVLTNAQATVAAVYDALDWLKRVCQRGDRACFYFSGHGDLETAAQKAQGYLLAYNSPSTNYDNHAIAVTALNDVANELSANRGAEVVLVTDACHSGQLAGDFIQGRVKGRQLVGESLRRALYNEVRLTACAAGELANEGEYWNGGAFSHYLLKGLSGGADTANSGQIRLGQLNGFLSAALREDKNLRQKKVVQTPVTDGNPAFVVNAPVKTPPMVKSFAKTPAEAATPPELEGTRQASMNPVDYFFGVLDTMAFESYFDFGTVATAAADDLPVKMAEACLRYKDSVLKEVQSDSARYQYISYDVDLSRFGDTLRLQSLQRLLQRNPASRKQFLKKFVQYVHNRAQGLIKAYIEGDLAELEKRQYYSSGQRNYNAFLQMLGVAATLVPPTDYMADVFTVNRDYLTGLIARLNMATSTDSRLLKTAFDYQKKVLARKPDAAYAHNELGNLYLLKNDLASALRQYRTASAKAPAWSIPLANLARAYTLLNKPKEAVKAIDGAMALQPGLSFNHMNAGWVREQKGDWLGAEEHYLKAVALNEVHFFPFEHLGNVYLKTGRFAQADYYFHQAERRKQLFALNERYFRGAVMQMPEPFRMPPPYRPPYAECVAATNATDRQKLLLQLVKDLRQLELSEAGSDSTLSALKGLLQRMPSVPLVHHYAGKRLVEWGFGAEAETLLLEAVRNYQTAEELSATLKTLLNSGQSATDNCLLQALMHFHYDQREDHYLLALVYEWQNQHEKAIVQYQAALRIEDGRRYGQASLAGYKRFADSLDLAFSGLTDPAAKTEAVEGAVAEKYAVLVRPGAAIKLARKYESLKRFREAEAVLLQQVAAAKGLARMRDSAEKELAKNLWLPEFISKDHSFGLWANRDAEAETIAFYRRVLADSSRNADWNEAAGLFLYRRLKLAYDRLAVRDYAGFTNSFARFTFPWTGVQKLEERNAAFTLPGTGEEVPMENVKFHPVEQALAYLQEAAGLSPQTPREVAIAIAELHNWLGHFDTATALMRAELKRRPNNPRLRNAFFETLLFNQNFTEAAAQGVALHRQAALRNEQLLPAATYATIAGMFMAASEMTDRYQPVNGRDSCEQLRQCVILHWLKGEPQKALEVLLRRFPKTNRAFQRPREYSEGSEFDEVDAVVLFRPYATARSHALLKQNTKAIEALEKALDAGFDYRYVLTRDEAWQTLRGTKRWKALLAKPIIPINYQERVQRVRYVPNRYFMRPY